MNTPAVATDNIASGATTPDVHHAPALVISPHAPTPDAPGSNTDADEYIMQFDTVRAVVDSVAASIRSIDTASDQDQRLFAAISCLRAQQKLNDALFDLVISMNNQLGSA